jgi:hypothetical protein
MKKMKRLTETVLNTLVGTDMTVEERNRTVHKLAANTFKYLYIVRTLADNTVLCSAYARSVRDLIGDVLSESQPIKDYLKGDLISEIRALKKSCDHLDELLAKSKRLKGQVVEEEEEPRETEDEFVISYLVDTVGMDAIEECAEDHNITNVKEAVEKLNSPENSNDNLKMFIIMLDHCPKLRIALLNRLIDKEADIGLNIEQIDLEKVVY